VSGTAPILENGGCPPGAGDQARRCFEVIKAALEQADGSIDDVVRSRMYITSPSDAAEVGAVHAETFANGPPAATMVVVAGLLDPRWRVEIEVEAVVGG
jgi:enamine deaminase RidA (YjgF/YER057c/UK114 family)